MQLVEAVRLIVEMSADNVICAKSPFTWGSDSVITKFTDEYRIPFEVGSAGYAYLLGQEDVAMVLASAAQKKLSDRAIAELVCHYAATDAWPAWFDDVPDAR